MNRIAVSRCLSLVISAMMKLLKQIEMKVMSLDTVCDQVLEAFSTAAAHVVHQVSRVNSDLHHCVF